MAPWRGRERRRAPRPEGTPTYLVERDAPEWREPDPFWARWQRLAQHDHDQTRFDAYPDHEHPFPEPDAEPEPAPSTPRQRERTQLVICRGIHERAVHLSGAGVESLDLSSRLAQAMLIEAVRRALEEINMIEDESESGQGLAEYALVLALIAIVAIVVLLFLGQQIAGVLNTVGDSI